MKILSLKIQITLSVILLVAGIVGAFSLTVARIQKNIVLEEMTEIVILQGRNLALNYSKPLLHSDPEFELHPHISRVLEKNADIIQIIVVDNAGIIKGHSDLRMIDGRYAHSPGLERTKGSSRLDGIEELRENDDILEAKIPIIDQDESIGHVYLTYSKKRMRQAVAAIYSRVLKIGLSALVAGSVISLLLALHITRPVSILTEGAELIGQGNLDTRITVKSGREIQALADTFNQMAVRLKSDRIAMLEKERMDKELEIAKSIQETLLPSDMPVMKGYQLETYYNPAQEVGGDYFDVIPIGGNRIMFIVGDVAGKGVPGLVIMAMARVMVRDLAKRGENPARLLRYLNIHLGQDIKNNIFLTLFCGILDTEKRTFDYASAAHMPILFYRHKEQTVYSLGTKAKPLGIFDDDVFSVGLEENRLVLEPGDLILQYTDGLTEMRNLSGDEYGFDRITSIVKGSARKGARDLLPEILSDLGEFRAEAAQSDDLTLLALSLTGNRIIDEVAGGKNGMMVKRG